MLVIGDSISTGYGIEGKDTSCHFSPQTQNSWLTYAAITSRDLNTDLVILASSGQGLVRNYDGDTKNTIPMMVNKVINFGVLNETKYNFIPDVIIVHLGTNDFGNNKLQPPVNFSDAYIDFVSELYKKYPNSLIYLAIGPMLSDDNYEMAINSIMKTINFFNKTSNKPFVKLVEFRGDQYNHFACDWHPNYLAHEHMASTLENIISQDLNWDIAPSSIFFRRD